MSSNIFCPILIIVGRLLTGDKRFSPDKGLLDWQIGKINKLAMVEYPHFPVLFQMKTLPTTLAS